MGDLGRESIRGVIVDAGLVDAPAVFDMAASDKEGAVGQETVAGAEEIHRVSVNAKRFIGGGDAGSGGGVPDESLGEVFVEGR